MRSAAWQVLRVWNVSKAFGHTRALDAVSIDFAAGEVQALMGENGAGKSTLGKIIAGLVTPDAGEVSLDGAALTPGDLHHAAARGVRLVHQELAQCPSLTVAENLCLHALPRTALGLLNRREMRRRARRMLETLDPAIDVDAPLGSLPVGRRQACQIAAALDAESHLGPPRVLILDEPTSSLTVAETERLLEITRRLAAGGVTVIYVTHRMSEVFRVADRVTVLRDGRLVATTPARELSERVLVEQMIGRTLTSPSPLAEPARAASISTGEPALRVDRLSSPGALHGVSLEVRAGEIVGLGGLVGAGRSELLEAIFGLDRARTGRVRVRGFDLRAGSPGAAVRRGVGYVPEDRRLQGLCFDLPIHDNIVLPAMARLARAMGLRSARREAIFVQAHAQALRLKASSRAALPGSLSGGNQQKVVLARWLDRETAVLLLDEPTRGIDVGTKAEIHGLIRGTAARGVAVLLVSSEMPELLSLSHRVLVMAHGRITGELRGEAMTQAGVLGLSAAALDAR